jgi:hypothetical protein
MRRGASAPVVVLAAAGVAFAALAAFASTARADDAACIAAAEGEIPLRKQGKLHDALKQLAVCADAACPAEVKAECVQRIEAVKAAMPTIILAAKDGAGNDLTAVSVTLDGAPVAGALDGRALDVDPGEHTFRFDLAGQPPLEKKLVLRQGEKDRRETVVLGPPPAAPVVPGPAPSSWSTQRTLALVTAGVGVVGLGLGAMFGAYAISSQSREKSDCSPSGCPSYAQGVEDYNTAQKDATGATAALAAGGALVAAGVVIWFTAPKPSAPSTPSAARATPLRIAPLVGGSRWGLALGVDL